TFRQTVIITFGIGLVILVRYLYEQYLVFAILIVAPLVFVLAFVKINDVNVIEYFLRIIFFSFQKKIYLWSSSSSFQEKERFFKKNNSKK
ncbi:MAG: hypothetical protein ACPLY7_01350, partial [Microgenomates group bacterium]